jgi:hypothetical protein
VTSSSTDTIGIEHLLRRARGDRPLHSSRACDGTQFARRAAVQGSFSMNTTTKTLLYEQPSDAINIHRSWREITAAAAVTRTYDNDVLVTREQRPHPVEVSHTTYDKQFRKSAGFNDVKLSDRFIESYTDSANMGNILGTNG